MTKDKNDGGIIKRVIYLILSLGVNVACAYFFPINPERHYSWLGGFWHGSIWIGNWILSLFTEGRVLMAPLHNTAYTIFYWIPIVGLGFYFVLLVILIIVALIALIISKILKR